MIRNTGTVILMKTASCDSKQCILFFSNLHVLFHIFVEYYSQILSKFHFEGIWFTLFFNHSQIDSRIDSPKQLFFIHHYLLISRHTYNVKLCTIYVDSAVTSTIRALLMDIELVGCNIKDEQNYCGNQTLLQRIAEQLQVNKPTSSNEQQVDGDDDRIIGSNLGIMESVAKQNEHRRAAVLICVFEEGHGGELRVILTKRSMNLSSYPGKYA